ncbi:MAG: polysaccharide biosynthesis/export family protein, partial [Chthoniobacteraceae bacterium]
SIVATAIVIASLGPLSAQQPAARERVELSSAAGMVAGTTSMEVLDNSRRLGAGDRLSYRVVQERRPPLSLMVTDSGEVEVPLIGRVRAAGRTCRELAEAIKPMLQREYFINATVIIGLDAASSRPRGTVYVSGQVRAQGSVELPPEERFTVSKAILKAGGFAEFADKRKVKLVRVKPGGGVETTIVDVDEVLIKGRIDKDPILQPDDRIIVLQKFINI